MQGLETVVAAVRGAAEKEAAGNALNLAQLRAGLWRPRDGARACRCRQLPITPSLSASKESIEGVAWTLQLMGELGSADPNVAVACLHFINAVQVSRAWASLLSYA